MVDIDRGGCCFAATPGCEEFLLPPSFVGLRWPIGGVAEAPFFVLSSPQC